MRFFRRVEAISKTDADAFLVDGITSVEILHKIRWSTHKPLVFNQIAGGKSPRLSIKDGAVNAVLGRVRLRGAERGLSFVETRCWTLPEEHDSDDGRGERGERQQ